MGFLSVPNFSSLINSQSLNCPWSVLLNLIALQLDKEGIKGREDDERGGVSIFVKGGRLFEGGNYSRDGNYSKKYTISGQL